jgi:hypothetical protein
MVIDSQSTSRWVWVMLALEPLFFVDTLIFSFYFLPGEEESSKIASRWDIFKEYRKTYFFVVEVLNMLPWETLCFLTCDSPLQRVLNMITLLPRLLRYTLWQSKRLTVYKIHHPPHFLIKISQLMVFGFFFFAHLFGCIFYAIGVSQYALDTDDHGK